MKGHKHYFHCFTRCAMAGNLVFMVESDGCFDLNHNMVFCSGFPCGHAVFSRFLNNKSLIYLFLQRLELLSSVPRKKYTCCSLETFLLNRYFFFFDSYFPNTIFFLLYSMVTQLHIHVHILFSHKIMLRHKWLDNSSQCYTAGSHC